MFKINPLFFSQRLADEPAEFHFVGIAAPGAQMIFYQYTSLFSATLRYPLRKSARILLKDRFAKMYFSV
jgi:hypothetical protein